MALRSICLLLAVAGLQSAPVRCPDGALPGLDGGSCVKVFAHQLVSWIEAEARCQSLNGHLITIHSALWNTYLLAITAGLDHPLPYWIGGEWDARVPGQWSWVDGTKWSYENWSEGQPAKGAAALAFNAVSGLWTSEDGERPKPFMCQFTPTNQFSLPPVNPIPARNPPTDAPRTTTAPSTSRPERCPLDWQYLEETRLCYAVKLFQQSGGSYSANFTCVKDGGQLASVPSASVNKSLLELSRVSLTANGVDTTKVVIGYMFDAATKKWRWVDGSTSPYSNWVRGQGLTGDRTCAVMSLQEPWLGKWFDGTCAAFSNSAVICERVPFAV